MAITEIRLLPPLAVARLGSSPEPLENYDLEIPDVVGPRTIVRKESLRLDAEGNLQRVTAEGPVQFRDHDHLIKPVAPFFELFARTDESSEWVPLTYELLHAHGLRAENITWTAHLANHKLFRRTGKPDDKIEAQVGPFHDHVAHALHGQCNNFLKDASVPLGQLQFAKPSSTFPGLRIRFTPAHGKVYGCSTGQPDPYIAGVVYDTSKGDWYGYKEPNSPPNTLAGRSLTNPAQIFAGYASGDSQVGYGYVDDECDGIIEAHLDLGERRLTAFSRVAAGPPTFAPDSKPIRTVADELEQALNGPDVPAEAAEVEAVRDIVRRALETVRLMNTGQLNKPGTTRGVGMARMDILDVNRESTPIFAPEVAESLAIRARHERVLLALESGSLVWFARVLREYDQVGDLTDEGRRKMPGMMRNADGRHLALTRRQVSSIRRAAEALLNGDATPNGAKQGAADADAVVPLNLTAQLSYRADGNPPNSMPDTAISNAYPGLEMDFRNAWRRILRGVTLHESLNLVVDAEEDQFKRLCGMLLLRIDGIELTAPVTGPNKQGIEGPLPDAYGNPRMALEWSNALAEVLHKRQGQSVRCVFKPLNGTQEEIQEDLVVRHFFEQGAPTIARDLVGPGDLTQSLCAPWQNDYRECACFYWAANRPDYVNVEPRPDGSSAGNNWMQKDRTATTPKVYINDDWLDDRLLTHTDLISNWEQALRFVIANQDEPPKSGS